MAPSKSAHLLVQCLGAKHKVEQYRAAGVCRGHQILEERDRFGLRLIKVSAMR